MRAIWKGAISFGLVAIGVKLYAATEEKDIRFHQVHRADGGRIKYERICSLCGEQVSYDEVAKGFDVGDGEIVVLTEEDFANLPLSSSRMIEVLEFVPSEQIDPIFYSKAYYIEPDGAAGVKPYLLLREALERVERVAVVKIALRQRETLATVRVRAGVLVLNMMLWPDEVRKPDFSFLDEDVRLRPQEVRMAGSLVDSMASDFDPDIFADSYREALQEVIDAKIGNRELVTRPEQAEVAAPTVDLMAALRESVDRARAAREEGQTATVTSIKKPTKKSTAKADRAAAQKSGGGGEAAEKSSQARAGRKATTATKATEKKAPDKKAAKKAAMPARTATPHRAA